MAKKALLDVLEQTIGKYVKNLDAESLNVAVWSGKIELNSLELDVDSVNLQLDKRAEDAPNLAMPFKVLSGRFETFQVDVPWAHITSRPVVLRARGLFVEVEPLDRSGQGIDTLHDATTGEEDAIRLARLRDAREQVLETANQFRLQAYNMKKIALAEEKRDGDVKNDDKSSTFTSRLVRRIIENIQIEIMDVHISLMDADGSAGVCLESLSLVTTDKDGNQVFVDRTSFNRRSVSLDMSFLYKMLQIEGLGVYLDEDQFESAKSLSTITEGVGGSGSDADDSSLIGNPTSNHSYILAPLSFEAKLRQADSNICIDYAKYHLKSQLDSISVVLSRNQLDIARKVAKVMGGSDTGLHPLFPEYRPLVRVSKDSAKEWWKYAVRCIGRLNGRRSWVEFFTAYKKRQRYIPLYKKLAHHMDCSWVEPLSSKEMDALVEIEHDRSISIEAVMAWRNIADAQIDKERQKYDQKQKIKEQPKKSYYSYLFGSSPAKSTANEEGEAETDDRKVEEAAIVLSVDEMKELEGIAKVDFKENELSKDSKLCDVEFILGALKVDLIAYDLKHVSSLDMGQVSMDFDAVMNGAFRFNFEMSDLEIFDRITPQSLFSSVLRMIEKPSETNEARAIQFKLSKSTTGDQSLSFKVAAFEAVASQLMVQELQRFFFEVPHRPSSGRNQKANPLLAQSLTGSVDLFYDAEPGDSFISPAPVHQSLPNKKPVVSRYDLSNALIDAWKEKTETKASWMVDIDIVAPVVLVPETCNDSQANVLVFDLGNLRLKYGKYKPSSQVQRWFDENPRQKLHEESYDSGTLSISDLTFSVQKARLWQSRLSSSTQSTSKESAIIDPIGMAVEFGIETIGSEGGPRFCFLGVIPTISSRVSTSQITQISPIINSWRGVLKRPNEDGVNIAKGSTLEIISTPRGLLSSPSQTRMLHSNTGSDQKDVVEGDHGFYNSLFCRLGLQGLELVLLDDQQKQLEFHLVSVYSSMLQDSNGRSSFRFRMGWFWILDWMKSDLVRRQRLVVHSNLPLPPDKFAENNDYNILAELKKQGAFEDDFAGSADLADVCYKRLSLKDKVPLVKDHASEDIRSILDAKFHSLFVHWNPKAITSLYVFLVRFSSLANDEDRDSTTGTLISTPGKAADSQKIARPDKGIQAGRILVKAEMESLNVILHSARDDLSLFILAVSGTKIAITPSGLGREISLSLGDVRVATPDTMGQTLSKYRTLLGLAPGRSESLLTVHYCTGHEAVMAMDLPSDKLEKMQAAAKVDFSPMRFCYIHSQVMTLVEYITDGILGALTARAANSAAEAAREYANSISGGSLFAIRARSLELLLPQAAHEEDFIGIETASIEVDFTMYTDSRGSQARVALSDVMLKDTMGTKLQDAPVQMFVEVTMPPYGVGSLDDQAMNVAMNISAATFLLTRRQYAQLMYTIDENIGESSLFLRDSDSPEFPITTTLEHPQPGELTHAGAQFEERTRRLYLSVSIKELSLLLNGCDFDDPIVMLRAVDARVSMTQLPDLRKNCSKVSLQNLFCEDRRPIAEMRQYRYLVDHVKQTENAKNIFLIEYCSEKDKSSIDLSIGSPQIVLIPDAISEILAFVNVKKKHQNENYRTSERQKEVEGHADTLDQQIVQIDTSYDAEEIETHLRSTNTFVTAISAKTGICRFVLVDLGSQLTSDNEISASSSMSVTTSPQLTETVVLQGNFSASLTTESDLDTGKAVSSEFQGHSDAMEMFTAFGREMKSPLQILEPAGASAHGSLKTTGTGEAEIEVRAAALSTMDFSISMHNAALLSAIINSLKDSFRYAEDKEAAIDKAGEELTKKEQERIENLATALDRLRADESLAYNESGSSLGDSVASSSFRFSEHDYPTTKKIQIKITMPQTRLTVINDLQGLDEALFRVSVTNFVAGGELVSPRTLFDFHCNTSILADYFDSSVNLWSRLLTKPWEITMKGSRAPSRRFKSDRLSSTLDLESFPCSISFSEQFLVSLASAARMWSIYKAATYGPATMSATDSSKKSSMTASVARNLITSFPHAVANHCGVEVIFSLKGGSIDDRVCPSGQTQYFRFDPPKGDGYGGRRAYGQDVEVQKLVEIEVGGRIIVINIDVELGLPPGAHDLGDCRVLFTQVAKEGKTTVLHLTTNVEIVNRTLLPFDIAVVENIDKESTCEVGRCNASNYQNEINFHPPSNPDGVDSKETKAFSIPITLLNNFYKDWESYGQARLTLQLAPALGLGPRLFGEVNLDASLHELKRAAKGRIESAIEVTCRATEQLGLQINPFALRVFLTMSLVADEHVVIDVSLEPRAIIENKFPIPMNVRTPMPQTYSLALKEDGSRDTTYKVDPEDRIEVFTPGPSIAITIRPRDSPVAGQALGWMDAGWVDLPLVPEFRLQDPIISTLPLEGGAISPDDTRSLCQNGAEVYIFEGASTLTAVTGAQDRLHADNLSPTQEKRLGRSANADFSSFLLTVCNYGVDHTGSILFEQSSSPSNQSLKIMSSLWQSETNIGDLNRSLHAARGNSILNEVDSFIMGDNSRKGSYETGSQRVSLRPLGAFAAPHQRRRITLLPSAKYPICLLQMTMEGDEGLRRTLPFLIEELPIGDGGASTVPLFWEDKHPTGHFAYRCLVNEHQSEIHIVPEFILYNGSKHVVLVKEKNMPEVIVEAGDTGQLRTYSRPNGLEISLNFIELECQTVSLQVGRLGLRVVIVRSYEGVAVGSVYIQTVIDTNGNSRLVVKIGEVKFGSLASPTSIKKGMFGNDFCRFRVRWTELQLILNEVSEKERESWNIRKLRSPRNQSPRLARSRPALRRESPTATGRLSVMNISPRDEPKAVQMTQQPIMTMIFSRFTVDFQRVFKEGDPKSRRGPMYASPERSQISVIVHNVQIKDLTPDSPYPMVFDSTSDISFIDLCIRIRGPLSADLVKVDLFDLNLAHSSGRSEKMVLTTSEAYVWRILDLINRILRASGDVAGFELKFEDDAEHGGYVIRVNDAGKSRSKDSDKYQYTAPKADTLYDIALARVSPFTLVVSFRRSPELARYDKASSAPGAAITNYFTRKLKFTIDKAELNFARYEDRTLKGPSDRLIETLTTVYVGRMKYKVVSLLSAASLQDWRYLAARDTGDDEYMEGDILRATGNLAGKSAGVVLKTVGRGVGGAVAGVSTFVGEGIEDGASKIGARRLGSGVSSVVTGVGHGVGDTLSGVGTGAGKFLQGAGQGVGHVFGGISGGALQMGKGIGKGITTGDGMAVVDGFTKGANSVGGGISQGAESAVMGAADGILYAGKGLFSGVKNVGQGIGGAFRGKKPSQFQKRKPAQDNNSHSPNNSGR